MALISPNFCSSGTTALSAGYGGHPSGAIPRLHELHIAHEVEFTDFDLAEHSNILRALDRVKPDEIYNLAAQSYVALSFEQPLYTSDTNGVGVMRLLKSVRQVVPSARNSIRHLRRRCSVRRSATPQDEMTPFHPRSPYGVAKAFAHWTTVNYRESYGMACSSGILFNRESPLRGREFVTRKITSSLARIRHDDLDVLELGNLDAERDWGYAGDYVEGMWLMLQREEAEDFVLATGQAHSVRSFVTTAAHHALRPRVVGLRSGQTRYRPAQRQDDRAGQPEFLSARRSRGVDRQS